MGSCLPRLSLFKVACTLISTLNHFIIAVYFYPGASAFSHTFSFIFFFFALLSHSHAWDDSSHKLQPKCWKWMKKIWKIYMPPTTLMPRPTSGARAVFRVMFWSKINRTLLTLHPVRVERYDLFVNRWWFFLFVFFLIFWFFVHFCIKFSQSDILAQMALLSQPNQAESGPILSHSLSLSREW